MTPREEGVVEYGPHRFTALSAVRGMATRIAECRASGSSVFTTIGHDRLETYQLALEAAAVALEAWEAARQEPTEAMEQAVMAFFRQCVSTGQPDIGEIQMWARRFSAALPSAPRSESE